MAADPAPDVTAVSAEPARPVAAVDREVGRLLAFSAMSATTSMDKLAYACPAAVADAVANPSKAVTFGFAAISAINDEKDAFFNLDDTQLLRSALTAYCVTPSACTFNTYVDALITRSCNAIYTIKVARPPGPGGASALINHVKRAFMESKCATSLDPAAILVAHKKAIDALMAIAGTGAHPAPVVVAANPPPAVRAPAAACTGMSGNAKGAVVREVLDTHRAAYEAAKTAEVAAGRKPPGMFQWLRTKGLLPANRIPGRR